MEFRWSSRPRDESYEEACEEARLSAAVDRENYDVAIRHERRGSQMVPVSYVVYPTRERAWATEHRLERIRSYDMDGAERDDPKDVRIAMSYLDSPE